MEQIRLQGNKITDPSITPPADPRMGLSAIEVNELSEDLNTILTEHNNKLDKNTPITGGTKTKIHYDNDGLVISGEDANIDDLGDVVISNPSKNQTILFNGKRWVNTAIGTSFLFSINTFLCKNFSTHSIIDPVNNIEIGSGIWKAAGDIEFTATYLNEIPTSSTIFTSEWSYPLIVPSPYLGPVLSIQKIDYPLTPGSKVITLNASAGSESSTKTITYNFYNNIFYGISILSTLTEATVESLANKILSNTKNRSITLTALTEDYLYYALPVRLGTVSFNVGGFDGGFESPITVSITNPSGFTEDYYVYRSTNKNLGTTTINIS